MLVDIRNMNLPRLVSTASGVTGTHTLVQRLVQRQFSTAPVCKSNNLKITAGVEHIKDQIRTLYGSPHLSAEYKYRNSKRLFAVLDAQLHHNELMALRVKHKNIERALGKPEVRQRFKEGLPDPVLTRAAINYRELRIGLEKSHTMLVAHAPSTPIITATRANKSHLVAPHIFHRELSGLAFRRPNAGTIKRFEAEVRNINASSHSADFRCRKFVRFFAMIDQANNYMEFKALHAKGAVSLEQVLKSFSTEQPMEQRSARTRASAASRK
ncbi:hypothetical protein MBLNU13_g06009t1 [Cladosporium sp. NU13]